MKMNVKASPAFKKLYTKAKKTALQLEALLIKLEKLREKEKKALKAKVKKIVRKVKAKKTKSKRKTKRK